MYLSFQNQYHCCVENLGVQWSFGIYPTIYFIHWEIHLKYYAILEKASFKIYRSMVQAPSKGPTNQTLNFIGIGMVMLRFGTVWYLCMIPFLFSLYL